MAKDEHLAVLEQGTDAWNTWRKGNPTLTPDLSGGALYGVRFREMNLTRVDFSGANLCTADFALADLTDANLSDCSISCGYFNGAILSRANLSRADVFSADFRFANLKHAALRDIHVTGSDLRIADLPGIAFIKLHLGVTTLFGADLTNADIPGVSFVGSNLNDALLNGANVSNADFAGAQMIQAQLRDANISGARFDRTNLLGADFRGANLSKASLIGTNLSRSNLDGCRVYGVSAWDVDMTGISQLNLLITQPDQPAITVDNIEVAQLVYLMLNNEKLRAIIDTITAKAVLILGNFTPSRKRVLDALRDELRRRGYLPIVFDFDKPSTRDLTETVATLAHMSRFVVVDITEARSIPQELMAIVPNLPSVPVQPLLQGDVDTEYGMFEHVLRYPWVLPLYRYADGIEASDIVGRIVNVAEEKLRQLRQGYSASV
jgi:uncharacterized protein YjbI with pentapeptide repeats